MEELGTTLSRQEMFKILVVDPMEGAIDVDWRDFFPYLKWIPNQHFENKIQQMHFRREAVMKALIQQQKKRIASGKVVRDLAFSLKFINGVLLTINDVTGNKLLFRSPVIRSCRHIIGAANTDASVGSHH